ncbi:MAG: hypothetical protein IJ736_07595 [Firmicutes bacterium]|nr:hypothetical protein [Bacillota bacterium]
MAAMKDNLYIEFNDHQVKQADLIKEAKALWTAKGNKISDIKTLDMYYKPGEGKCYCVFNGKADDSSFSI